jgi:hypothetical protein
VGGKKMELESTASIFKTSILYFVNVMRFASAEVMCDVRQVLLIPKSEMSIMVYLHDHYVGHALCDTERG